MSDTIRANNQTLQKRLLRMLKRGLIIAASLALALAMFPIILPKVKMVFPDITSTGWAILTADFVVMTLVCTKIIETLEKRKKWTGDRLEYTVITIVFGLMLLVAYYYWEWLEPFFGQPVQN